MDSSKGKARQTNIIDDPEAIARAMQGGQRKVQPKKKNTGCLRLFAAQNAGVTKSKLAKKVPATPKGGPRFFEKDGLKIPLYDKSGRKKSCARASKGLRNKNIDQLLDIVEAYAGACKRKQFKDADVAKSEIADWIEAAETRALPANPQSRLPADAVPAKEREVEPEKTRLRLALERKDIQGKDKVRTQVLDHVKRKHDNVREPTQASQQTPKRHKIQHRDEPLVTISRAGHKCKDDQAESGVSNTLFKKSLEKPTAQEIREIQPEQVPKVSTKHEDDSTKQARRVEDLKKFMRNIKMHPEDPNSSSMVVHLAEEGEDRVLTASTLKSGRTVMHSTSIPYSYGRARVVFGQPAPIEKPFLKTGKHGRHGDFISDRDRRTGRGHQITIEDDQGLEEYISYRGQVLEAYPRYPMIDEEQEIRIEVREDWVENETWRNKFVKKYPGYAVSHLWPCGCEKARGESEDEESEEE